MRYFIRQKIKAFCAFLIILILLPYTISVFVNGADVRMGNGGESPFVSVRTSDNGSVADLSWKEYVAGILAREMPEDYEPEALRAQAVLIRTKLYRDLENSQDKILTEKYMTRGEMEKKWKASEYREYHDKYIRAVEETDDTVLFYNGTYAWTPYHQSSCGYTRSAEEVMGSDDYPYIALRECPLDKKADDEIQSFVFSYEEIQEMCRDFLVAESEQKKAEEGYGFDDFEISSRDSAGYVNEMRIGQTTCTGDQFRDALSLPSSAFSFSEVNGKIKITTTGKGHGLGMSQWTANEMAKEGKNYEEILSFFFEGTELNREIQETEVLG